MQHFARIADGVVQETFELPPTTRDLVLQDDGTPVLLDGGFQYLERPLVLVDVFPTDLINQMRPCPPAVEEGWTWDGEAFFPPPATDAPQPLPRVTIVPAAVLFDRLTEEEGGAIDEAMQKRALKFRGAWNAVVSGGDLRSDQDVWDVLRSEMIKLFGEARTDVLTA